MFLTVSFIAIVSILLILAVVLESILNRYRGHGSLFTININGNITYAFYMLVVSMVFLSYKGIELDVPYTVIWLLSCLNGSWLGLVNIDFDINQVYSYQVTKYYGIFILALYILGESYAWGKWVGYITADPDEEALIEYDNDDGRSFPFVHYIANFIIDQKVNYTAYCYAALAVRGIFWWLPLYSVLGYFVGEADVGAITGLMVGLLFPIAAWLGGRVLTFKFEFPKIKLFCRGGWERQELVYGLFQGLSFWAFILCVITK